MASVDGVYRATCGFSAYNNETGQRYSVRAGETVREGHWILAQGSGVFVPLEVDYEHVEPEPVPVKRGPGRPRKDESDPSDEK